MEQARYLVWAKSSKPDSNPYLLAPPPPPPPVSTYGDSWEEQAFAEDAAGVLGGCVWPPRSYSCSFCRREFRSAQALGGHMNVHRRDRARLKQSPVISPTPAAHDIVAPHQNHVVNPCAHHHVSFDANPFPSHHFVYNNPNPEIRVSSPPPIHNKEEKNSSLSFFSPIFQPNHVNHTIQSPPPSWSSFVSKKRDRLGLNLVKDNKLEKEATSLLTDSRAEKDDCVTEDHLSVNLNLVVSEEKTKASYHDEEVASSKRRRIEANPLSLLQNLSGMEKCNLVHQSEDLDLELRLGDAPKVKYNLGSKIDV